MTAMKVGTGIMDLTTTVRFAGADADTAGRMAVELEAALIAEIGEQGVVGIKKYFVRPVGTTIQVGLRFVGMDPQRVEDVANHILRDALEKVSATPEGTGVSGKRTSTLLVGA